MERKKRSGKTTKAQYNYYVDYLTRNEVLRTNKNTPEHPKGVEEAYEDLKNNLNAMGGPVRSVNAWKKVRLMN